MINPSAAKIFYPRVGSAHPTIISKIQNDIIIIPKGEKRGVKALSELTVLHVVAPPPSDMDHKEVHARLAQGKFD